MVHEWSIVMMMMMMMMMMITVVRRIKDSTGKSCRLSFSLEQHVNRSRHDDLRVSMV